MRSFFVNCLYICLTLILTPACGRRNETTQPGSSKTQQNQTSPEKQFATLATQWQAHCQSVAHFSDIPRYLDHPSYRGLVKLGLPAIPFAMKAYREQANAYCTSLANCDLRFWNLLLEDITGIKRVQTSGTVVFDQEYQFWSSWWSSQQK